MRSVGSGGNRQRSRGAYRQIASRPSVGACALAFVLATATTCASGKDERGALSSYADLTGSFFTQPPQKPSSPPRVRELAPPPFTNATAIWGATGRDSRGRIWFGVSAEAKGMSARLYEYHPEADVWHDRGIVLSKLMAAGLARPGEGQIKIHSRIVQARNGWLYFASTDEEGERLQGEIPPKWGGHLWRIHPERLVWEHLHSTPEGLVAVSGVGRYIYALGYWGHVLYQHDTETGRTRKVVVGAAGGHVSRNFLADIRGNAFVPRVRELSSGRYSASLVEYDATLKEVADTPLDFYLTREAPDKNHGMIGMAYMPDGSMLFTTHAGHLYRIGPREGRAASVMALGWWYPRGQAYAPSLFALGGPRWVTGVAAARNGYEWVAYEPAVPQPSTFPLALPGLRDVLLYGSITRDNAGRVYVGGWAAATPRGQRPLVLQIEPGP